MLVRNVNRVGGQETRGDRKLLLSKGSHTRIPTYMISYSKNTVKPALKYSILLLVSAPECLLHRIHWKQSLRRIMLLS